jgi:exopolysaccharide biosynthesis polyprenyl glycosylphosphotransferase
MTIAVVNVLAGHFELRASALIALGFFVAALLTRPLETHAAQLPLMRHLAAAFGALLATVAVAAGAEVPPFSVTELATIFLAGILGRVTAHRLSSARRAGMPPQRIAVLGPDRIARALASELRESGVSGLELVGRIATKGLENRGDVPLLGRLEDVGEAVVAHDIDLLILACAKDRMSVVDEVTTTCLELDVRLIDLTCFCERTFGHVPVSEINASWFGFLMHPAFKRDDSWVKRAIDLVIAGTAGLVFLPVLALVAPFIRRDRGPVFFTQTRIGEGGRPFRIYKLRTMSVAGTGDSAWTERDDPRVTRIGALLRRTHLDEFPQVINVLKGEMSIVGPRPEQPSYVGALENEIPFYSRRHLIKPGITGWAQVRCGYAGSVEGSAWKMCHDLYYVKHRSLALDLIVLGETVRTFFADRQFAEDGAPVRSAFAAGSAPSIAEGAFASPSA